jgi:pimeloyl-ACP methyl ester carboxylesterase
MTSVIQQTAKTEFITGAHDVKYAYRRFGAAHSANPPLLMLPHFRATMDTWDPIIVNTLARDRPIILLDFPGVGQSTGSVASSFSKTADQVIDFLSLIKEAQIDLFGFSIGGCIAQMVTLNGRPGLVRKIVIASNGPSVGVETVARDLLEDEMAAASTATFVS